MAPAAPPHTFHHHHVKEPPSPANVFEGPEKKLEIWFNPPPHSQFSHCLPSDRQNEPTRKGLRTLTRQQIDTILHAAACTILSVQSNHYMDAYLLSESSLFVSDFHLMIKTCGTTTLLHALPVLLNIAYKTLRLSLRTVQFSRVSYLFPHAQPFPHDIFDNEVAFLNKHLHSNGRTFHTKSVHGCKWHMYCAQQDHSLDQLATDLQPHPILPSMPNQSAAQKHHTTLELFMFDLDPRVMSNFMFHDRLHLVGTDKDTTGTTTATHIASLLHPDASIDAFNFEPCGYSMNALYNDTYYTIHVSPEEEASYVSFETTAHTTLMPQLIASVVRLFRPGRFITAIIHREIPHAFPGGMHSPKSWSILSKLLQIMHYREDLPVCSTSNDISNVMVAAYSKRSDDIVTSMDSSNVIGHGSGIEFHLQTVAAQFNAHLIDSLDNLGTYDSTILPRSNDPCFLVDLRKIASNVRNVRAIAGPCDLKLRYALRCNSDKAILSLLAKFDILFEVTNVDEIQRLQAVGVPRKQVVLVTPVLSPSLLSQLGSVGLLAIFGRPSEAVADAAYRFGVGIEIRVNSETIDMLDVLLSDVMCFTSTIESISIDANPAKRELLSMSPIEFLQPYLDSIQEALSTLPKLTETVSVHVGELLSHPFQSQKGSAIDHLRDGVHHMLSQTHQPGVEVSRLIVDNSVSLVTNVIGRRYRKVKVNSAVNGKTEPSYHYFLNDGVYGAFSAVIMNTSVRSDLMLKPKALQTSQQTSTAKEEQSAVGNGLRSIEAGTKSTGGETASTLFGPTCDAIDRIWVGKMPVLKVGDRVLFPNMGAYTSSTASSFNGFARRFDTRYVVSKSKNSTFP